MFGFSLICVKLYPCVKRSHFSSNVFFMRVSLQLCELVIENKKNIRKSVFFFDEVVDYHWTLLEKTDTRKKSIIFYFECKHQK